MHKINFPITTKSPFALKSDLPPRTTMFPPHPIGYIQLWLSIGTTHLSDIV